MNLRYLVPALGVIAVSANFAAAEDAAKPVAPAAPAITFDGWIDTVGSLSSANEPANSTATRYDERLPEVGFTNISSLKANIKVSDTVTGKINIFINPAGGTGASTINVREAYSDWAINSNWTWQAGKYIDSIGWLSPEPTGLLTVFGSQIGYQGLYGNDIIGTSIAYTSTDAAWFAQFDVTNGYFNQTAGGDAAGIAPKTAIGGGVTEKNAEGRGNSDLGYGLALKWNAPDKVSFIQFDAAYDPHGTFFDTYQLDGNAHGAVFGAGDEGGNALLLGLQGQYEVRDDLLLAAEGQYFTVSDGYSGATKVENSGGHRAQGLLLANWKAPKALTEHNLGWISSFTAELQAIDDKSKFQGTSGGAEHATQETLAVLTNPTGSNFFALNGELTFSQFNDGVANSEHIDAVDLSIEALLSF